LRNWHYSAALSPHFPETDVEYIGRFAPSPTGPLHFGSLVAALASWLDARAAGGRWLLRMEDLDKPREQPGAADAILRQLESLGLGWDGSVLYQSRRTARYRAALERLTRAGLTYPCGCTRREIADSALGIDGAHIYPGTCRSALPPGKPARATRLRTTPEPIEFFDRVQGLCRQSVEREVGDFVVLRADGLFAYQLAVVVDDADQGVTDVVRGADLLDSTARQILLQRQLGFSTPRYAHLPVAVNAAGEKLSKQTGAAPIDPVDSAQAVARALLFLGHPPPIDLPPDDLLPWALAHWDIGRVPRVRALAAL
jgi:glutamyl-Q tRNA(Asp) synthetase